MVTSGPTHHLPPLDVFHMAHTLFCSTTNEKTALINIKYVISTPKLSANIWWTYSIIYITLNLKASLTFFSQRMHSYLRLHSNYIIMKHDLPIKPKKNVSWALTCVAFLLACSQNSLCLPLFLWCWSDRWCPRLLGCYWWCSDSLYSCTKAHCTLPENTHTHKPLNKTPDCGEKQTLRDTHETEEMCGKSRSWTFLHQTISSDVAVSLLRCF